MNCPSKSICLRCGKTIPSLDEIIEGRTDNDTLDFNYESRDQFFPLFYLEKKENLCLEHCDKHDFDFDTIDKLDEIIENINTLVTIFGNNILDRIPEKIRHFICFLLIFDVRNI